jgi:plasmid stabilization system protein ParE
VRRRVRVHADFLHDLRGHLGWLTEHRDPSWIERLRIGIDEAIALVARFPDVGSLEGKDGTVVMRRLILRKIPYVIWFLRDAGDAKADIWFIRLFHTRQDRPPTAAVLVKRRGRTS